MRSSLTSRPTEHRTVSLISKLEHQICVRRSPWRGGMLVCYSFWSYLKGLLSFNKRAVPDSPSLVIQRKTKLETQLPNFSFFCRTLPYNPLPAYKLAEKCTVFSLFTHAGGNGFIRSRLKTEHASQSWITNSVASFKELTGHSWSVICIFASLRCLRVWFGNLPLNMF